MNLSLKIGNRIFFSFFLNGIFLSSFALPPCEIKKIIGQGNILINDSSNSAKQGDFINEGSEIETKSNSLIKLKFNDDSEIVLGEKSKLKIWSYLSEKNKDSVLSLLMGKLKFLIVPKMNNPDLNTTFKSPNAVMGIRGTQGYIVSESPDSTKIAVTKGSVFLSNKKDVTKGVYVNAGFWGQILNEQPPEQPKEITKEIFESLKLDELDKF